MNKFSEIKPADLNDNIYTDMGKKTMLLTAVKPDGSLNTMTVGWGLFGIMWSKPVFACVVRPQRYTFEFAEQTDKLSLTVLKDGFSEAMKICGTKSGRDCDKIKEAGLHLIEQDGFAYFEESRTVYLGKKLYCDTMSKDHFLSEMIPQKCYPANDYHKIYVCEIEAVLTANA